MYLWRFRDSGNIKKNFTLPWSQNWIWHIIPNVQFRQNMLNQMWPPMTSPPVVRSVAQIEGQARNRRRKLRWVHQTEMDLKMLGTIGFGQILPTCKSHIWQEVVLICLCMFIVHMLHQIRVLKRLCWDSTPHMSLLAETNSIGVLNGKA